MINLDKRVDKVYPLFLITKLDDSKYELWIKNL